MLTARFLFLRFLNLTAFFLLVICTQQTKATVLHRGLGTEPVSLNPHYFAGTPDAQVLKDLYEGLMVQDKNGQPVPGAAAKVDISQNRLTYTFSLRKDLRWSDGSRLTAEDFERSFKQLADPERSASYRWYLAIAHIKGADKALAGNPEALGVYSHDQTLTIVLDQPAPYLLGLLTFPSFLPVPQGINKNPTDGLVSNGAYQLRHYHSGDRIELTKNPHYRCQQNVNIKHICYLIQGSTNTEVEAFALNQLQLTSGLNPGLLLPAQTELKAFAHETPLLATSSLIPNTNIKPLDNLAFRRALSMAIDRQKLVKHAFPDSKVVPACSFTAPLTHGFSPDNQNCKRLLQNPRRKSEARELLQSASIKADGISLTITSTKKYDAEVVLPELARQLHDHLGINISIRTLDWSSFVKAMKTRDYELIWFGWLAAYNDATAFLQPLAESPFYGPFKNADYLKELELASQQETTARRLPFFQNAEAILSEKLPLIPILHPTLMTLVKPEVKGFYTSNPEGWVHSRYLKLQTTNSEF